MFYCNRSWRDVYILSGYNDTCRGIPLGASPLALFVEERLVSASISSQLHDRNQLFGELALQLNFITPEALEQGLNICNRDAGRSLGQVLVEQGTLRSDARALLDALLQQHLAIHGGDPQKSLVSLTLTRRPEHNSPTSTPLQGETLIKNPSQLPPAGASATHPDQPALPTSKPLDFLGSGSEATNLPGTLIKSPSVPSAPPSTWKTTPQGTPFAGTPSHGTERYRSLRPHAKGGLGEVFVALDMELGRHVALKQIQAHHADHADSRARFLLEAEITGGLEHPGVVPVYGMGCYADGRPYYAMRFIQGQSLQSAISRFHDADKTPRDPGRRTLELRQLLGQFVAMCQAVAYAHSRGVIHRDLKPANVMLGDFGETLVIDWGMAKAIGRPDVAAGRTREPLQPPSGSQVLPTQMDSVMGTPAYMSPEQASGQPDLVGPPSDIYSLGATLYHLLTGQAAFAGCGIDELFERLKKGELPPPRQVKRQVPPALEAVCLKALALRPEDRYDSARALATEVEHYLADEPVSVYVEPLTARLARWARWHRTLVAASAVMLISAVFGLTLTTVLVSREQGRTEVQRRLAESNFQTALRAVDDMLTEVAEEQLASEPRMEKKRRALLAKARSYYEEFLEQRGSDPSVRKEAVLAHKRLGDISRLLGEHDQSKSSYDQAITLLGQLVGAHPDKPEYRSIQAECYCNLGEVRRLTSHPIEAEDAYQLALAGQRGLVAGEPGVPAYQKELARTQYNRGILFSATLHPKEAEAALDESVQLLTRLTSEYPHVAAYRQHLARAYLNLGPVLRASGRPDKAEDSYRRAIRLQTELVQNDTLTPDYRYELGGTYNNLGYLLLSTRPYTVAEMILPAAGQNRLGLVLLNAYRYSEAEIAFRQGIAQFEVLARDFPSVPVYRKEVANTENNLAIVLARAGNWTGAEEAWERALDLFEKLAAEHPEVPDYQGHRGLALGNLGWLLLQQKDLPDVKADAPRRTSLLNRARHRLERAIELDRVALKPNPRNPTYLRALCDQSGYLAEVLLSLGDHAEAARLAEELPRIFQTRGEDYVRAAELLVGCMALAKQDARLPEERRRAAAERYAHQTVRILREGVGHGFGDSDRLTQPPFTILQDRADFKELLTQMKAPAPSES
jgi:tetratricopeptide (TPR) repeat protein